MSQSTASILIASDSRGRGITNSVAAFTEIKTSFNVDIALRVKPGAKLQELIDIVNEAFLRDEKLTYAIIIGGICNLTERSPDRYQLSYNRSELNIQRIISQIQTFYHKHNYKATVATLYPASLENYATSRNTSYTGEVSAQEELIEDIDTINQQIVKCNKQSNQETVDIGRIFFSFIKRKRRGRKKKFCHRFLPDGVHPSESIQEKCGERIATVLRNTLNLRTQESQDPQQGQSQPNPPVLEESGQETSQDSQEEDTDEAVSRACKRTKRW